MTSLTDDMVEQFQRDGVLLLRGAFKDWTQRLSFAVEAAMAAPSPLQRSYQPADGSARFFQDYCRWRQLPEMRDFVFNSDAAALAARLMRSKSARFFHDHILVKPAGTSQVTPWHQDQPYYCVEGVQSVSFWVPLDPVAREVCMECVAGSHRWSEVDFEPQRFDGTALYANAATRYAALPDIDSRRDEFDLRGWALEPGDAIAFNFRTVHGAPANRSTSARRVVSSRWVGDDARWAVRSGPTSPPFPHLAHLTDGAAFDAPDFPLIFTQPEPQGARS
jgi:ectoine hydroxylase-related dioxygenase (phytanoyl-CoA dioxygenase family)